MDTPGRFDESEDTAGSARSARRDACGPGDPYPVCGFRVVVEIGRPATTGN
jgi:hypothetical protein